MKSTYLASSKEPRKKLQDRFASRRQGPWSLERTTSQPASGTRGSSFSCASRASSSTRSSKPGIVAPATGLPVSGWSSVSAGGAQRTVPKGAACRGPSLYHCMFVVPRPILPVATSTSKRMESWSVAAPARPARKTHAIAATAGPPPRRSSGRPRRLAVMTRNVDSGAPGGNKFATKASLAMTSWMIQSPPASAFRKKWMPMPPSSFLCLTHSAGTSSTGDTATPRARPRARKAHLFSMS
mmetsp:Transcript_19877/g.68923  ORF Transcript_19877/g.68923 Transcript_19877/m.68923 type:complete len:240 (-) Transcript_19877:551-1270(-)